MMTSHLTSIPLVRGARRYSQNWWIGGMAELVELADTLEFSFEVQAQTLQYSYASELSSPIVSYIHTYLLTYHNGSTHKHFKVCLLSCHVGILE